MITPTNPDGIYSCWCFSIKDDIFPGQKYNANSISLLDPSAIELFQSLYYSYPTSYPLNIYLQTAFNAILWIFNMVYEYETVNNYTFGDIQTAIWNLLFTNINTAPGSSYSPIITDGSAPYISENVAAILNGSLTNINNYPNMKTMICKTNKIIGNLMLYNYNYYNYNQPAQIVCISTIIDCDCCVSIGPEYIYVFNTPTNYVIIGECSVPIDVTQVVAYNMPSNYTIVKKGISINSNNNGLILNTTGVYEANFSITGFPLSGNIISFKLITVPAVNNIPATDFTGATTIVGSIYKTETDTINAETLTGNCKFIANAWDTVYLVNNTLSQITLLLDKVPSSTCEPSISASLDIILLDNYPYL